MARYWLIVTRVLCLCAVLISAALYVHYLNPIAADFCGLESGCETLRKSPLGYFGNRYLSLPLFGLLAYFSLFLLSLCVSGKPRTAAKTYLALFYLTGFGGGAAVLLLAYQAFVAKAFCWLCVSVDITAVLASLATARLVHHVEAADDATLADRAAQFPGLKLWAWLVLLLAAVATPFSWAALKPLPPLPPALSAFYQPGKINVFEFADFECPYCRALYPVLERVSAGYPERVNIVRFHMPLPQHVLADPAARAAICVERLAPQHLHAVTERLFTDPLTVELLQNLAPAFQLEPRAFADCLDDDATNERLARDAKILRSVGFQGLPTTLVNSEHFVGVRTEQEWQDTFAKAARGEADRGVPAPGFLAALALLLTLTLFLGRARGQTAAGETHTGA